MLQRLFMPKLQYEWKSGMYPWKFENTSWVNVIDIYGQARLTSADAKAKVDKPTQMISELLVKSDCMNFLFLFCSDDSFYGVMGQYEFTTLERLSFMTLDGSYVQYFVGFIMYTFSLASMMQNNISTLFTLHTSYIRFGMIIVLGNIIFGILQCCMCLQSI